MHQPTLASIIISNYNYARFLGEAIDSALNQSYTNVEVIVVDDGSADDSREVIGSYGNRITSLLKENGGMASAWNTGFRASRGEVILFLDADDTLAAHTFEEAIEYFEDEKIVKVHWPVWEVDANNRKTGRLLPGEILPEGDWQEAVIAEGPDALVFPPIHGNAWSRRFLEKVFPIPEREFRQHSDTYLMTLAPVYGTIRKSSQPRGFYRMHGGNDFACLAADEKTERNLEVYDSRCAALRSCLERMGVAVDPQRWKDENSHYKWMKWQHLSAMEIKALVPHGSTFILVDEDNWGEKTGNSEIVGGRHSVPFLEHNGEYWGPPTDDATAISELERLRRDGATFIVFAWPGFWWMEYYSGFASHLRGNYRAVVENERVVVFNLNGGAAS